MSDSLRATPFDAVYPARLRDLDPPPDFYEAMGVLAPSIGALARTVAIVGTREPTDDALAFARRLARALAAAGSVVVSGGAIGIDRAAHEGALEAGGRTVVVLPAGIDEWTPPRHRPLFERVLTAGALVALRPVGEPIRRSRYLDRNAVIAALADHVVVVSAPVVSGARSTAAWARKLGRPLWVVPGAPWDATMAGCAHELVLGARPLDVPGRLLAALELRADDELYLEPIPPAPPRPRNRRASEARSPRANSVAPAEARVLPEPTDPAQRAVLAALSQGARGIDELVLETGFGVAELRAVLLTWTVEGVVREGPAGVFLLVSS